MKQAVISQLEIVSVKVWSDFIRFNGISTIVGHLMPNPFYTYIKYMISEHIL